MIFYNLWGIFFSQSYFFEFSHSLGRFMPLKFDNSMSANRHKSLYKRPTVTSGDIAEHLIVCLKVR